MKYKPPQRLTRLLKAVISDLMECRQGLELGLQKYKECRELSDFCSRLRVLEKELIQLSLDLREKD